VSTLRDHILVIGDCALEHTLSGAVVGSCPEAPPVPLLLGKGAAVAQSGVLTPGDAAAVAAQAARFAGDRSRVSFASIVGRGALGTRFVNRMQQHLPPGNIYACFTRKKRGMTVRTRIYSGNRLLARVDHTADVRASGADLAAAVDLALSDQRIGRIVLVDRGRGAITRRLLVAVRDYARTHSIPILASPRNISLPWGVLAGAGTEVTLVCDERAAINLGCILIEEDRLEPGVAGDLAALLQKRLGVSAVVVTLGDWGAVLHREEFADPIHCAAPRCCRTGDPTGAGVAFLAALAVLGGPDGIIVERDVQQAGLAAGLAIDRPGPVLVDRVAWANTIMLGIYREQTGRVHAASAPGGSSPPPPR
jgi:bifunctional ADP-heptose synthase (sugar kinase/adenylyltransferase)